MPRLGMDDVQVDKAGRDLKARATDITNLMNQINGIVTHLPSIWEGPDARKFVNDWWPQHKHNLIALSTAIDGLGQSALNNAQDQRDVSNR